MPNAQDQTPPPTPQLSPIVNTTSSLRLITIGQFVTVVFIWSLTPLAAVLTVKEIHWVWGLFLRFGLALPFAFALLYFYKIPLPLHKKALVSYCAGALGLFGSMTLCYIGAVYVPSAVISMIYGFAPLISGLMCIIFLKQPWFSKHQTLGLALAILGLGVAIGIGSSGAKFHTFGILIEFLAVILYVISALLLTKIGGAIHPIAQMTGATLFSWIGYLCLLPFFADIPIWQNISTQTYIAIIYSALGSSVLAMSCYYGLIQVLKTNTLMLITIITPMLATLWGMWLNQETLGHYFFIGVALVCAGLYVYIDRKK